MRGFRRRFTWARKVIGMAVIGAFAVAMTPAGATAAHRTVPTPPAGGSVITVKTSGDRTGDNGVTPLAGVRLALFANQTATTPIAEPWATCVSDGDGDCNFIVPETGAGATNNGSRFYVRQLEDGVPDGWYTNPRLRTGPGTGEDSQTPVYQFQTPAMAAGQTYRSTGDFMYSGNDSNLMQSGGVWQNSRDNPRLTDACGLDVALVMDTSGSMQGQMGNLRNAANTFVNSLVGTPSRVATFSFSNGSPGSQAGANHPEPRSVSTQAGADAVKEEYANWQANGGTNWDQGFNAVARATPHYDIVVFITDGNPTYFGTPFAGSGSQTTLRSVENGIFSANAVKDQGSRVIAFGVGAGAAGAATALNLRAVSGPVAYSGGQTPGTADYYQTENFQEAGDDLRAIALQQCSGTLSVVKQIVPPDNTGEDVSGAANAGPGWTFHASSTSGAGGLPADATTTDDGTGAVSFQPTFPAGAEHIDMTVTENQHPDHTLVTQGGDNAVCTDLNTGERVAVRNTSGSNRPGFTVDVPANQAVSCRMYNRPPRPADITVHKVWDIDGERFPNGTQPDGFGARLMLTGPGDAGPTEQAWGHTRTGYRRDESATFSEDQVRVPDPTCRPLDARVTSANGAATNDPLPHTATLARQHNSYTVTNSVTCGALLTLVKKVDGGHAHASDWTLSADGPTPVSGHSGGDDVTDAFVDPGTYTLTEADGPGGYDASAWSCENHGEPAEVTGAQVTLHRGDAVTCTIENTPRPAGGWTVHKTSDPPSGTKVSGGQVITYTITARSRHDHADDVRITDDLREVLNSSAYVRGSLRATAGHATLRGTALTWAIPRLEGEQTLTYQVRVNDGAHGRLIANIVHPGPHGECVTACKTQNLTPPAPGPTGPGPAGPGPTGPGGSSLPFTGTAAALLSTLAAALIATGIAATWWSRHHRTP